AARGDADNVVAYARGAHADLLTGRKIATGEGVTGWVLANRQPFCNTDPKLDLPPQLAEHFSKYRTLAVFPVIKETEMHGALTLYSSALTEYNADHRRLLEESAKLLAALLSTIASAALPLTSTQSITATQSSASAPTFGDSSL